MPSLSLSDKTVLPSRVIFDAVHPTIMHPTLFRCLFPFHPLHIRNHHPFTHISIFPSRYMSESLQQAESPLAPRCVTASAAEMGVGDMKMLPPGDSDDNIWYTSLAKATFAPTTLLTGFAMFGSRLQQSGTVVRHQYIEFI